MNQPPRLLCVASMGVLVLVSCSLATPAASPSAGTGSGTTRAPLPTPSAAAAPTEAPAEHIIGVQIADGVGEFYNRQTGEKFVPRGSNYIRVSVQRPPCIEPGGTYHSLFNVGNYDPVETEAALAAMQRDGYNTVRVFLNGNCLGRSEGGLNEEYVQNVADFLRRAQVHGVFVLLTTDDPPVPGYTGTMRHNDDIEWGNRQFLTADGVRSNGRFWRDLIAALARLKAPLEIVLSYQLRNEQFFLADQRPLNMTSGEVRTGNGKTYDMANRADKQRMMDENIVYWIDGVRSLLLEADPTALVSVGFFWPQKPHPARIGDVRLVSTAPPIRESSADFIDLHPYSGWELTLQQYVDNYGMAGMQAKPIIMGEFGASRGSYPDERRAARVLQNWQVQSCSFGFDGWLVWTYDAVGESAFYDAMAGGGLVNQALAPINRPDPCKPGDQ
jgi:cellulase (glycosyl hydrolase family 5)